MLRSPLIALAGLALLTTTAACTSTATPAATTAASSSHAAASTPVAAKPTASATSANAASADPCSFATVDQIAAAFGGTVSAGKRTHIVGDTRPQCEWADAASSLGSSGDVYVAIDAQDATQFGYAKTGTPNAVDLSGIGDGAFYSPTTGAVNLLVGDKTYMVQGVFGVGQKKPDPAALKTAVVALAKDVATTIG